MVGNFGLWTLLYVGGYFIFMELDDNIHEAAVIFGVISRSISPFPFLSYFIFSCF
jgi:hypothetical protein